MSGTDGIADWGVIDAAGRFEPLRLIEKDSDAAHEATSVGASCAADAAIRAQGGTGAGWENDQADCEAEEVEGALVQIAALRGIVFPRLSARGRASLLVRVDRALSGAA